MRLAAAAVAAFVLSSAMMLVPANAATCQTYLHALGEDRSLFDGFIYGYVSAKLDGKGAEVINYATLKVKDSTTDYCLRFPDERVEKVVALFADIVRHALR